MADQELLVKAIQYVIRVYPGLRVRFTEHNGSPVKYLVDDFEPVVERIDLSAQGEEKYLEWAAEQSIKPLPMLDAAPYRIAVADVGNGTAFIYTNYHHIAVESGGADLVHRQVLKVYEALLAGKEPECPDLPALDAARIEEQRYLSSKECDVDKTYWHSLFETIPEPMDVAGRPTATSMKLDMLTHCFAPSVTKLLMEYCSRERISPFRVVAGALGIVLSRTLRRNDVVMGTATANRHPSELRDTVGMYVSTCVLRLQIDGHRNFKETVVQAADTLRNAIAHERYPYDLLSSDLRRKAGEAPDLIGFTLVEMVRLPLPSPAEIITHCHGESLILRIPSLSVFPEPYPMIF